MATPGLAMKTVPISFVPLFWPATGAIGIGLTDGRKGPFPVSAADGEFQLNWQTPPSECDAFLVLTVVKSLQQMEQHYPGFLKIRDRS